MTAGGVVAHWGDIWSNNKELGTEVIHRCVAHISFFFIFIFYFIYYLYIYIYIYIYIWFCSSTPCFSFLIIWRAKAVCVCLMELYICLAVFELNFVYNFRIHQTLLPFIQALSFGAMFQCLYLLQAQAVVLVPFTRTTTASTLSTQHSWCR